MKQGYALLLSIIIAAIIMIGLWIWQADNLIPTSEIRNLKAINDIGTSTNPINSKVINTQQAAENYAEDLTKELK